MKKLHIGCGKHIISGWDNLDYPHIDARNCLNYKDNSIDYIFHEHMLEHLDEVDGFNFLKECFRILKIKGKMRISIPSFDGFIECYNNWNDDLLVPNEFKKKYRNRTDFLNKATLGEAAGIRSKMISVDWKVQYLNNNDSWHKYYYTKEDIYDKLHRSGFSNIEFKEKHISDDTNLQGLERRVNEGIFKSFPKMLDLTVECTK
jgi:predicted SAM-dependent methyltransferase